MASDPWYDFLAFPIAPFVLFCQLGFLFVRRRLLRWGLEIACVAAIVAMREYIIRLPEEELDDGVNIGVGLMEFWLVAAFMILGLGVVREVVETAIRLWRLSTPAGRER